MGSMANNEFKAAPESRQMQRRDLVDESEEGSEEEGERGEKRKRQVPVSCELCKQRKVKCDRNQPACGWCTRNNAQCEYKERKKPGLRAGYGRELEGRLDKLDEIIRSHSDLLETLLAERSQRQQAGPDIETTRTVSEVHPGSAAHIPQQSPHYVDQRDAAFGFGQTEINRTPQSVLESVSTHAAAGHGPYETQPAQVNPSPSNHIMSSQNSQHTYYTDAQQPLVSPSIPMPAATQAPDRDLPPYDLLYQLVDLYFKHINTWCPILHRRSTFDTLFGQSTPQEPDRILLHAIVATTMRYSTDARLTPERTTHYHKIAKQKVLLYGMETSSVRSLQALVILALDILGSGNGPPGWNIMALITRSVVQLGLAVETTSFSVRPGYTSIYTLRAMILPEPADFIEEEGRRRLFWMIYLLDRYSTIATAFEFALDEKEIDRALPCRDELWLRNQKALTRCFKRGSLVLEGKGDLDHPENLGAFGWYIEVLGILSKVHAFLKEPIDISAPADVQRWQDRYKELDHILQVWKASLPAEFAIEDTPIGKDMKVGWVMLQATYHTAVIRLHSSAAYPTVRSTIFTPSYSASQRCNAAVSSIAGLASLLLSPPTPGLSLLPKLGPPFAFTLWVAARLLLVHGSTVERALSPQVEFFVGALGELGRWWPVAQRYAEVLRRVLDEFAEFNREKEDSEVPGSVRILADMRRTAFDLDFLISRQPSSRTHPGTQVPANIQPNNNDGNPEMQQNAAGRMSNMVTPVRTPQPNELEYLDVFDFFNMPRLPQWGGGATDGQQMAMEGFQEEGNGMSMGNEYNITNYMVDANSDWLFQEGGKFMGS